MPLGDAGLSEHASPLLPGGPFFPVAVGVEVEVGVEVYRVEPIHAAVGDASDNAGDVDVAVLEVIEGHLVRGGYGQGEHGAVGEDGAGAAAGAGVEALAADDQLFRLQQPTPCFPLCGGVAPAYADIQLCSSCAGAEKNCATWVPLSSDSVISIGKGVCQSERLVLG